MKLVERCSWIECYQFFFYFIVSANQAVNLSSRKDSNSKLSDTAVSSPSSTNLEDFPLDKVSINYDAIS